MWLEWSEEERMGQAHRKGCLRPFLSVSFHSAPDPRPEAGLGLLSGQERTWPGNSFFTLTVC